MKTGILTGIIDGPQPFILGFCFHMYISHIYFFKMSWITVIFMKIIINSFIISYDFKENFNFSDPVIILIVLTTLSFLFDYQKDKNDRNNFYTEYLFCDHFENFKHILEEIPDQVIIWHKKGPVFANKATFELFKSSNLTDLQEKIMNKIEIKEQDVEKRLDEESNIILLKQSFSTKIQKLLNAKNNSSSFQSFVANVNIEKADNSLYMSEFDIRIKRIYWEKEVSLILLLNQVDEKNMKARLDFVNCFLTSVLGNVSHEMNTPVHILFGMIEQLSNKIHDDSFKTEIKIMKTATEILMAMIKIMIDIFDIEKGCLYLNMSKMCVEKEITEVLNLFDQFFKNKKLNISIDTEIKYINTDTYRFKIILIFLMKIFGVKMIFDSFKIHISSFAGSLYKFEVDITGEIYTMDDLLQSNLSLNKCTSLFRNSKTFEESEFSMISYLIQCLSCGKAEGLETLNINHSENDPSLSNIKFIFKINDVNSYEPIKLKDSFQEKNNFWVKFVNNENNLLTKSECENFLMNNLSEDEYHCIKSSKKADSINIIKEEPVSPFRILNVDDIYFSLMVVSNYCHTHNLPVIEAKNGLEAFEIVENLYNDEKKTFDLIFMDCDMPIMNGFESAKKINEFYQEKKVKNAVILAITANVTNNEIVNDCELNGMKEVWEKPLRVEQFKEILKRFLKI